MGESIWLQSIINQRTSDSNHTSSPTVEVSFKAWYCKIQFLDALGTLPLTWGCSWSGEPGMWTVHLGSPFGNLQKQSRIEWEKKTVAPVVADSSSSLHPISCTTKGCIRCTLAIQLFNQVDAFVETCWQSFYNYMLKACPIKYTVQ